MSEEGNHVHSRAAALKASSRAQIDMAVTLLARSLWRITSSRAMLLRRRPPFSGGVDPEAVESAVRQRVRALVDRGVLPGRVCEIRGGMRDALGDCSICGIGIGLGEVSLAVTRRVDSALFIHRRCFDIWKLEAGERGAA
jgi:hypothetical protein